VDESISLTLWNQQYAAKLTATRLTFQRKTVNIEYDLTTLRVTTESVGVPQHLKVTDLGPGTSPVIHEAVIKATERIARAAEHAKLVITARSALDKAQEALLKAAREKEPLGERANTYRAALEAYQALWVGRKTETETEEFDSDEEDGLNSDSDSDSEEEMT